MLLVIVLRKVSFFAFILNNVVAHSAEGAGIQGQIQFENKSVKVSS
jgi:hypothetical protein